ncbi:MAG TPA: pyridoxal phosphate-dependent aminotransferase, partial [Sediminispirochaeta sp.]|nr:pyridoxal phosphate-dependent aminotransferase [Sediminispirochaeta sp.]
MNIEAFKLERFFAKYEFQIRYQMSTSDCESMSIQDLLEFGGAEVEQDFLHTPLGYTESLGHPRLRELVARGSGVGLNIDQVLIAVPEEAIFLTLQAHLDPEDHVIVMTPAYQSLSAVPKSIGCSITPWPVELRDGGWQLDLNLLQDSITDRTKLLIINVPHNPTGLCLSGEQKKAIADLLRKRGILLFADEMYHRLEYDPQADAETFCRYYEKAICLSGLSKAYGLPGLRIGWLT